MDKKIILTTLLLIHFLISYGKHDERIKANIAFDFEFISGADVLETNYLNNGSELKKLYQFLKYNLHEIKSSSAHLSVLSYIKTEDKDDLQSINRASILASVVRAHLKIKYGLINENFSFYIVCDDNDFDKVTIEYKPYSIKPSDNQEIYYTQNISYKNLTTTIIKYGGIPYLTTNHNVIKNSATFPAIEAYNNTRIEDKDTGAIIKTVLTPEPKPSEKNIVIVFSENRISEKEDVVYPIIGVSTNLMKLFGVTPTKILSTLPNIAMEYYFEKKYSVKLEGVLTPLNSYALASSEGTWRKASSLSLEARYWLGKSYGFDGLYTGLFGLYGDYDIKSSLNEVIGNTGDFYGAGISVGYCLKLCNWLSVEAGIRGLYRVDKCSKYEVRDDGFFLNDFFTKRGFFIHDFNLAIVLRYGLKKK